MKVRVDRLRDEIRDLIAISLSGGRLQDPRLQMVTVTAVKLSGDLQIASVYFRVLDEAKKEETKAGLIRATGYLKHVLAKNLDVRRVPHLKFYYDTSIDYASRIEHLLEEAHSSNPSVN